MDSLCVQTSSAIAVIASLFSISFNLSRHPSTPL
jgi:hypothetical protein